MSAYQPYYFFNKSMGYLLLKFTIKSAMSLFKIILLLPLFYDLFKISSYSNKKILNIFLFLPSYIIQEFAFRYGEIKGLFNIIYSKKK